MNLIILQNLSNETNSTNWQLSFLTNVDYLESQTALYLLNTFFWTFLLLTVMGFILRENNTLRALFLYAGLFFIGSGLYVLSNLEFLGLLFFILFSGTFPILWMFCITAILPYQVYQTEQDDKTEVSLVNKVASFFLLLYTSSIFFFIWGQENNASELIIYKYPRNWNTTKIISYLLFEENKQALIVAALLLLISLITTLLYLTRKED